ncbi:sodium ion-translocating decarboxylase subunit beta [Klebsiella pneumoniae subsp. pneumoniae]|nr:sodium ion-translocating decarboxylase subunit beta [Klebsiella pneumoniae subsp. pneumoniae]
MSLCSPRRLEPSPRCCWVLVFGLPASEAASIATIGGADGPMVLFASLILAPNLFVPIAIIAYLYLKA